VSGSTGDDGEIDGWLKLAYDEALADIAQQREDFKNVRSNVTNLLQFGGLSVAVVTGLKAKFGGELVSPATVMAAVFFLGLVVVTSLIYRTTDTRFSIDARELFSDEWMDLARAERVRFRVKQLGEDAEFNQVPIDRMQRQFEAGQYLFVAETVMLVLALMGV
jgi:hypothetical protein